MKKLKAFNGESILIDDEDYDTAKQYNWSVKNEGKYRQVFTYSHKTIKGKGRDSYKNLILGLNSKMTLFKNNNPLDLRRKNIIVFDTKSEYISVMGKKYRKKNPEFNLLISKAAQGQTGSTKKNSKYIGVRCEPKNLHPWVSIIKYNRKSYHLGSYTKEEYAGMAYDKKALELYGPDATVNFPSLTIEKLTEKLEKIKAEDAVLFEDHFSKHKQGIRFNDIEKTSKYIGVCLKKDRGRWRATINYRKKQYSLGNHATEKEAALAYDKKALELYGTQARLNFPVKKRRK